MTRKHFPTKNFLISFEENLAKEFNAGKIPHPVHFANGNEDQLIEIFKDIQPIDWVFGSWRMHYHALLKGVPSEDLRNAVHRGESMSLKFPSHKVYGSAIVGGSVPIALGVALSIKREDLRSNAGHVWCFVGDMTAETGIFHECHKYAELNDLPITFVVEDNHISVCTDTAEVWGGMSSYPKSSFVRRYKYESKYPHAGAGKRVEF